MIIKDLIEEKHKDANLDLATELKQTKVTSYDAIDALMKKIAKQHNITAEELHDLWMKKYNQTPDDWIKAKLDEGPVWDKVKKTAAAGAVAGAVGYGALSGQAPVKDAPARAPLEITIPGGDIEQPASSVKQDKVKSEPSVVTNADPKMEKLVFLTAYRSGIKGNELAQFMAQVAHETQNFKHMTEVGSKEYFKRYDPKYSPKKAKILGNTEIGDGERFRGRGFIQITGRDNYRRAGKDLNLPLEQQPNLAAQPDVAAKIAVWFWKNKVKPKVQDYSDTISVTTIINPSMNGLGDRDVKYHQYLERLRPIAKN
jgi:predicted chitinase